MKVLISDEDRLRLSSLRGYLGQEREVKVTGIATEAETSPHSVIAREFRRILDGCPICDSGYRGHDYALLASVGMDKHGDGQIRLRQFRSFLQQCRWRELLRFQECDPTEDFVSAFAFRCTSGRLGIVTIFSPAKSGLRDIPLHYTILPVGEGHELSALLESQTWMPLYPSSRGKYS